MFPSVISGSISACLSKSMDGPPDSAGSSGVGVAIGVAMGKVMGVAVLQELGVDRIQCRLGQIRSTEVRASDDLLRDYTIVHRLLISVKPEMLPVEK